MTASFRQDDISIREQLDTLACLPAQVGKLSQEAAPIPFLSGRNYIINGQGAINQRGFVSVTGPGYAMDRWYQPLIGIDTSYIVTGSLPQINITNSSDTQLIVRQAIELLVAGKPGQFLKGKTFTLSYSIWSAVSCHASCKISFASSVANTSQVEVVPFTIIGDEIPPKEWVRVKQTFTIDKDPAGSSTCITVTVGAYKEDTFDVSNAVAITSVQLEQGTEATPYEEENMGVTLAKCQRYYERIPSVGVPNHRIEIGQAVNTTNGYFNLSYSPKRTVPTVTASAPGDFQVMSANNSTHVASAISFAFGDSSGILANATTSASLVAGNATQLVCANANTAIYVDAEL